MWIKNKKKNSKLAYELLGLFAIVIVIFMFLFFSLSTLAFSISTSYCEKNNLILSESTQWNLDMMINNISFAASMLVSIILFFLLLSKKIAYLKEIIRGIDALRTHRMNYTLPLEGDNEFTELAEAINYLAQTELELKTREEKLQEEKESFLRSLSHDIRTPLTSLLSYSEYMNTKETVSEKEMREYAALVQKKAQQIKILTDQMLDGGQRSLEYFENGKFLFEQLAEEWESSLETDYQCKIDFSNCHSFTGKFDVLELQRIFDNLASNIGKYADTNKPVHLTIFTEKHALIIEQKNTRKSDLQNVESNLIGLENIRNIVSLYQGNVITSMQNDIFSIQITFKNIK